MYSWVIKVLYNFSQDVQSDLYTLGYGWKDDPTLRTYIDNTDIQDYLIKSSGVFNREWMKAHTHWNTKNLENTFIEN